MEFFSIRFFLVQSSLTLFPPPQTPKDLFIYPIRNKGEVSHYGKKYTFRTFYEDENCIIGYLLKSLDTHLIQLETDLFNEQDIQNWEKILFVLDKNRQILAFEYSTAIATPENIQNVLYGLTEKYVNPSGYDVKLEFLIDEFAFWQIIKESNGLYQIGFDLNAPNLFGGSKKANEWLKTLKEKHNMSKVSVDFRNDNADLKYDEEELESYRDYADSGGGNWTLGVLKDGHKKKYTSSNHLRRKEIPFENTDPRFFQDNIGWVREQMMKLIELIDK